MMEQRRFGWRLLRPEFSFDLPMLSSMDHELLLHSRLCFAYCSELSPLSTWEERTSFAVAGPQCAALLQGPRRGLLPVSGSSRQRAYPAFLSCGNSITLLRRGEANALRSTTTRGNSIHDVG